MNDTIWKWLRGWSLWQVGSGAVGYLLAIEAGALTAVLAAFSIDARFDHSAWIRAGLLLAMAVIYGEACDRIERLNRYLAADGVTSNQNSVICFAGVLVLPVQLAALLTLFVYLHTYLRSRPWRTAYLYRTIFMAAATVLATFAAGGAYQAMGGQLRSVGPLEAIVVLLTILTYTACNLALLLVCLYLVNRPTNWRTLLPQRHHVAYENSTLLFGAFSAVIVLHAAWLSPLILVLVASLHRASLVTDLQHSANTDAKTGVLNFRGWQLMARQQLAQADSAGTSSAVLLIDLDHFKNVNDTHGHLAGDVVLKSVAEILVRELRGYDAVGRYGGEEFIALLPGVSGQAALAIGERLRQRIGGAPPEDLLEVTASVGIAVGAAVADPNRAASAPTLDDIIDAADIALYKAKTNGRNRVCLAPPLDSVADSGQADQRRAFRNRTAQPVAVAAEASAERTVTGSYVA
ncbi:MAG: GGDEF domain-containing protein [Jatrophihabitantaceae bacterium]